MDAEFKKSLEIEYSEMDTQRDKVAEAKRHMDVNKNILTFSEASFLLGWEEARRWAISHGVVWPSKL